MSLMNSGVPSRAVTSATAPERAIVFTAAPPQLRAGRHLPYEGRRRFTPSRLSGKSPCSPRTGDVGHERSAPVLGIAPRPGPVSPSAASITVTMHRRVAVLLLG